VAATEEATVASDVLLLSEAPIATVQLVEQLVTYLGETTGLGVRSRQIGEVTPADLTPQTFPLFLRASSPGALRLARDLRAAGIGYGYYLDDNFWLLDPETEIGAYYAEPAHRARLDEMVRSAHSVVTSTPLLRDYLRPWNDHVRQLDSFFDFSLVPSLPRPHRRRQRLRVGFAASAHRGQDLEPVVADVLDLLKRRDDVEFEVIGVDGIGLPDHPRIRRFPYLESYSDYVAFQASRGWDVGLAPLGGAASNLYKTDNKFREYAAQGIPGVYQDATPYASVRDGETGLLAGGARSWGEALDLYLGDHDLRARVRTLARADAERRCSLQNVAPAWSDYLTTAPEAGAAPAGLPRVQRRLARRNAWPRRAARRLVLLVRFGVSALGRDGVRRTAIRTVAFVVNRVRRG
jgi:hypothetical protein